jgi:hypothetical protein
MSVSIVFPSQELKAEFIVFMIQVKVDREHITGICIAHIGGAGIVYGRNNIVGVLRYMKALPCGCLAVLFL